MVTASASDVDVEITTYLSDAEIDKIISRVDRDIEREMSNPPADGTNDRQDLEAVLAALFIATSRDRAEESVQTGRTSADYEQSMVDQLRARAKRLGAPDSLVGIGQDLPAASITVHDTKGID